MTNRISDRSKGPDDMSLVHIKTAHDKLADLMADYVTSISRILEGAFARETIDSDALKDLEVARADFMAKRWLLLQNLGPGKTARIVKKYHPAETSCFIDQSLLASNPEHHQ